MRRGRKLSLDALAERTGLTKSYLSKVERGVAVPSIASIIKLSAAFGVDVAHLFGEAVEEDTIVVERRQKIARRNGSPDSRVVPIARKRAEKTMSPFIMYPSTSRDESLHEHAGEELIYVLDGEVEATLPDRKVRLNSGDTMYFDGHVPHQLRSIETPAEVLIIISKTR
ncbi:MAG: hypothetical protein QOF71_1972 [Candidatus Eremiobacteraeota bacterium]|nr:hypothetical protein [Candidatus Eremiobacteraeota bacterium]